MENYDNKELSIDEMKRLLKIYDNQKLDDKYINTLFDVYIKNNDNYYIYPKNKKIYLQEDIFLDFLNSILKINKKDEILKVEEFKNIEKSEIIKIENDPNYEELVNTISNNFDKKILSFYQKDKIKNYSITLLKSMGEILNYNVISIPKRRTIDKKIHYYHYFNIQKKYI